MKIKTIFFNSGDEIEFDAVCADLSRFYIDSLNNYNLNKFKISNNCETLFNELKNKINEINSFLPCFVDFKFEIESVDQKVLNKLHYDWAYIQKKSVNVKNLDNQYGEKLFHLLPDDEMIISLAHALQLVNMLDTFNELNLIIHSLEESFSNLNASTEKWIQIQNPFPKSYLSKSRCQLYLPFAHLGRTLYNKFLNRDNNLEFKDENSFEELLGFVKIDLSRQQTVEYSKEYTDWCARNNREVLGEYLNIGQLNDLEDRLTYYRQIILNNVKMQNNFFLEQG